MYEKTKINLFNLQKQKQKQKKTTEYKYTNDKVYRKVKDHCYYTSKYGGASHSLCNSKYSIPKQITVDFKNRSNFDYHFIIKGLAKEFIGQFNCIVENTEKRKTLLVPITRLKVIDKNGEEITKTISYKL